MSIANAAIAAARNRLGFLLIVGPLVCLSCMTPSCPLLVTMKYVSGGSCSHVSNWPHSQIVPGATCQSVPPSLASMVLPVSRKAACQLSQFEQNPLPIIDFPFHSRRAGVIPSLTLRYRSRPLVWLRIFCHCHEIRHNPPSATIQILTYAGL